MMMTSVRSLVLTTAALAFSNSHGSVEALKLTHISKPLADEAQLNSRENGIINAGINYIKTDIEPMSDLYEWSDQRQIFEIKPSSLISHTVAVSTKVD